MSRLDILSLHNGTGELRVEIDVPLPEIKQRIRTRASLATTRIGLGVMLGHMLSADYAITVRETLGGGTSVRLTRIPSTSPNGP